MYTIAICDDEQYFIEYLKEVTSEIMCKMGIMIHLATYLTGKHLLEDISLGKLNADIIFLDILMKTENGIDIATKLRNMGSCIDIVFITSTADYSLQGYEVEPLHYIIKPPKIEKIEKLLLKNYKNTYEKQFMIIHTKENKKKLYLNRIYYIESLNRKIIFHGSDNNFTDIHTTLNHTYNSLPSERFIRCHKSFIVNLDKIIGIKKSEIQLKNNKLIPVGRFYSEACLFAYTKFVSNS